MDIFSFLFSPIVITPWISPALLPFVFSRAQIETSPPDPVEFINAQASTYPSVQISLCFTYHPPGGAKGPNTLVYDGKYLGLILSDRWVSGIVRPTLKMDLPLVHQYCKRRPARRHVISVDMSPQFTPIYSEPFVHPLVFSFSLIISPQREHFPDCRFLREHHFRSNKRVFSDRAGK